MEELFKLFDEACDKWYKMYTGNKNPEFPWQKQYTRTKKENLSTSKSDINLRKHLMHFCTWSTASCSTETLALRKIV